MLARLSFLRFEFGLLCYHRFGFVSFCLLRFFGTLFTETQIPKPCTDCFLGIFYRLEDISCRFCFSFPAFVSRDDSLYRGLSFFLWRWDLDQNDLLFLFCPFDAFLHIELLALAGCPEWLY